ncbi:Glutathione S-transferase omega-like 2 [Nakaseomyces bracarensis]|uniref:Glutathione S-transferase omega-like 2 n=1 Tax=Nakaseomyces bracarensis TaxID=273131 RepID=A0ABR4NRB0_9SACH
MSKQWADGKDGVFRRQVSSFRETISASHPVYKPAKGRYWLYVSLACPWAHRTLITRALKGLTSAIGVSVVHWHLDEKGWRFLTGKPEELLSGAAYDYSGGIKSAKTDASTRVGDIPSDSTRVFEDATFDPHHQFERLSQLYLKCNPEYKDRFTVPVLWDTETQSIVNNESSEIIRILNSEAFDEFRDKKDTVVEDLVPKDIEADIDEFNKWVYDNINNGVYKAGFSENPKNYEDEVTNVFNHLDKVEKILADTYKKLEGECGGDKAKILTKFFAVGERLTEADVRMYTTIIRFDPVYVQHFKCNFTTIRDGYPHIHLWMQNLYWNYPAFRYTTDFNHIKLHYTRSHSRINPLGLTPLGPKPDIKPL